MGHGDESPIMALVYGLQAIYGEALTVIEGGARGADSAAADALCAAETAHPTGATVATYPADWKHHGKGAGPIRNQRMLDEGKPDIVYAFVNKPMAESRGTADMVRRAREAGIPTYVVGGAR